MHRIKFALLTLFLIIAANVQGTPTPLFWTFCNTDIQATGVLHFSQIDYFTVFNRRGHGQIFPLDIGLTYGLFTWNQISAEVGVDYFGGNDDPLYFNGKIGVKEDVLFCAAPAFNIGIFNVGTRHRGHRRTDQNVVDIIFGKTLPDWLGGRIFAGAYSGSRRLGKNRQGFMVGYDLSFCKAIYCEGVEYYKWIFCADYASGKNTIGGGGVSLCYLFTPDIFLQTGPVWFNDARINGTWKWSVQFNVNIPVVKS